MARGEKTPAHKVAEFRAKYIELGNTFAAARAVGIPETTGWHLAKVAEADHEFVEARSAVYARVVPEAEERIRDAMRVVHERLLEADLTPHQLAQIAVDAGLKSFSYQNPKPQYFKGLIDAYKALIAARKTDQAGDVKPTEVHVTFSGPDDPA